LDEVKGGDVLSDAKVQRQVQGIASYFNMDPATIIGSIQSAGEGASKMVSQMEAAYLIAQRMHLDAFALANRIGLGDLTGFATREEAVAEFKRQVAMASSMFAAGQSMRAAMGRGMRRLRTEFSIAPEMVERLNSLDGEQLMQLVRNTMGDPEKLAKVTNPSFLRKASEELGFF